jgi:hypothetical protein
MRSSLWTGGNSHHAPNRTPGKLLKTFGVECSSARTSRQRSTRRAQVSTIATPVNRRTGAAAKPGDALPCASVRQQQIFLCEQFAQIPYRLDGFILSGRHLDPMPYLTPRRRPPEAHRLVDVVAASLMVMIRRGFGVSLTMMGGMIGKSSIPVKVAQAEPLVPPS